MVKISARWGEKIEIRSRGFINQEREREEDCMPRHFPSRIMMVLPHDSKREKIETPIQQKDKNNFPFVSHIIHFLFLSLFM